MWRTDRQTRSKTIIAVQPLQAEATCTGIYLVEMTILERYSNSGVWYDKTMHHWLFRSWILQLVYSTVNPPPPSTPTTNDTFWIISIKVKWNLVSIIYKFNLNLMYIRDWPSSYLVTRVRSHLPPRTSCICWSLTCHRATPSLTPNPSVGTYRLLSWRSREQRITAAAQTPAMYVDMFVGTSFRRICLVLKI